MCVLNWHKGIASSGVKSLQKGCWRSRRHGWTFLIIMTSCILIYYTEILMMICAKAGFPKVKMKRLHALNVSFAFFRLTLPETMVATMKSNTPNVCQSPMIIISKQACGCPTLRINQIRTIYQDILFHILRKEWFIFFCKDLYVLYGYL